MLYSEFVENTGCKETDHNYQVYKELELIYMNSDSCTKEHIYEMGRKLVDNSKTPAELELEAKVNREIDVLKGRIDYYKMEMSVDKAAVDLWKADGDKEMVQIMKNRVDYDRRCIKEIKNQIAALRWVIG